MVVINGLHKSAIERWIKARNPALDVQAVDLYSMWDSSLSATENHRIIQEKLKEYGFVSDQYAKQDCVEWEQRTKEWYEDESKKYEPNISNSEPESIQEIEYVEISGTLDTSDFYGNETVYAIVRPAWIDYEKASHFLGLIEDDLALLKETLGVI